jgi:hypothetical protein
LKQELGAGEALAELGWQLYDATGQGDGAMVSRLLAAEANPNASVTVWSRSGEVRQTTAGVTTAVDGRLEVVRLLLEGGADPSLVHGDGITPLMTAATHRRLEVLRLLLEQGVVVDAVHPDSGMTAFHLTCITNQAQCAEALVLAGCDVGLKTISGRTGPEVAEENGYDAMATQMYAWENERPAGCGGTPCPGGGRSGGGGGGRGGT